MCRYNSRVFPFIVERNLNELNDLVVKQIADQTYTNRRHSMTARVLFPTETNNFMCNENNVYSDFLHCLCKNAQLRSAGGTINKDKL